MNLLITSAGRRGYIIEYFRKAINGKGMIHVGNSTPVASALHHADKAVITPLIYDEGYIPFLIDYCKKERIDAIISLFDIDLMVLAKNKRAFDEIGTRVIVSDEDIIDICNDKLKTYEYLLKNDINTPLSFSKPNEVHNALDEGRLTFPIMVKPRWGMGSIAVYEADDKNELKVLSEKCSKNIRKSYLRYEAQADYEHAVLFQEKIDGNEFGMDVINDLDGNYVTYIVKKKMEMRAGETDSAMVVKDERFGVIAEKLSKTLRHIGNLDVDLFDKDGELYVLEMNARFGGGYPFSHAAGIDLPGSIVKWINGESVGEELTVKKYNELLCKEITVVKA